MKSSQNEVSIRASAANFALVATILLTSFKFAVGWMSGSVGVISEGIHSLLDLISAAIASYTVRHSIKPADEDHPFGHGKYETVSSLFEALLLFGAAGWIIYEGFDRFWHPHVIGFHGAAIATMAISLIASYWVYRHNVKAAREVESSALHANAIHFLSDVVSSGGILVGLILMKVTGWLVIDSIMAFGVAAYIISISIKLIKSAVEELVDIQLPADELKDLDGILLSFRPKIIGVHELRTRRSGSHRHIDFHLSLCGELSVNESHELCDKMEAKILERFPTASVNIHVEPCEHHSKMSCPAVCEFKEVKRP